MTRTELELWRRRTTGSFACAQFRGRHFYLASDAGQRWVVDRICARPELAQNRSA